jgi:SAM-dependent methyltransferase
LPSSQGGARLTVFGEGYALSYDAFYADKPYEQECDRVEELFGALASQPVRTILDLGCGTGNHSLRLAARGYSVTGVDRSKSMLREAASKRDSTDKLAVEFVCSDLQDLSLGRKFDAALMMFNVFGYQLTNAEASRALEVATRHLNEGGLLIFDFWYGPAVLAQGPSEREQRIALPEGEVVRNSSGRLDLRTQRCIVNMHVRMLRDGQLQSEFDEEHQVRFFFPMELELLLQANGLELLDLQAWPDATAELGKRWDALAVARHGPA